VQRRQIDAILNSLQHVIGDDGRFGKPFAAMHHPMTDGVNICRTLDLRNPRLIGDDVSHYKIQRRRNVAQRGRELLPGLLAHLQGHNRFPADAFHFTLAQASSLCCLMRSRSVAIT